MSSSHCHDPHAQETESIAIVGMAMRLPGGVNTPEALWDLLISKEDGHCRVPSSRYNVDAFYHPSRAGSVRTQHGYFLPEDPTYFDNRFFSIPSIEAARLDPQQRLLLEVIWECMESGGQVNWRGNKIGCFVGVFGEDWLDLNIKDTQRIDRYHVLGTGQFALSNRISYEFDLTGPSMTLESGCSSSLVALHQACTAILTNSCPSAIVAGTNLILSPTMTTTMSDNLVLSPSGICQTFSATADGYGRAEGINALYIKRLSDAIRDGDPVRAVIRAIATNCDGKTPGITTPGSATQKELILSAYKMSGIEKLADTGFFECHGTGTVMGDTAEVSVVADLFRGAGVVIGSIKPNLGHSEGASGITSIIKTVLALEQRTIPPNIHFKDPNPKIPFQECRLVVPVEQMPWPVGRALRASVNCFGIGGANAHVILEAVTPVAATRPPHSGVIRPRKLLAISAATPEALEQRVADLQQFTKSAGRPALVDLAYTLGVRRDHLKYRTFAIPLGQAADSFSPESASIESCGPPEIVLVFTGQGAQWAGMARELLQASNRFKSNIAAMDKVLRSVNAELSWSIEDILTGTGPHLGSRMNEPEISQPVCTAVQIALFNILEEYGIKPSAVVGHSSGEIAAAYAAGAFPLSTAILLAYFRGQCTKDVKYGAMAAIGVGRGEVEPWLHKGAVIACDNSPSSTTVSGDTAAVEQTIRDIGTAYPDVFCRRLRVNRAYHSHHMSAIAMKYEAVISRHIHLHSEMRPLYSTVTGNKIIEPASLDQAYWTRNLTSTVEFTGAIESILRSPTGSNRVFIEVGPHSALQAPLRQIFEGFKTKTHNWYIPTLVRGQDAETSVLRTAGVSFTRGTPIDFLKLNGPGSCLTNLPRYPWQHTERLLSESRLSESWRFRRFPHHELLGSRVLESSEAEPSWRNVLQIQNCGWLWHHKLYKDIVFPCAGYIALVGEAIRQHRGAEAYEIRNLVLKKPLFLPEVGPVEIITSLRPGRLSDLAESDWFDFTVVAREGDEWGKYCQGQVRVATGCPNGVQRQEGCIRRVDASAWYHVLARLGLNYGKSFQMMRNITVDPVDHFANAFVTDDPQDHDSDYMVHPTVIDQSLQILSVASTNGLARKATKLVIPASIGHIYVSRGTGELQVEGCSHGNESATTMTGHASILREDEVVLVARDIRFFSLVDEQISGEENSAPLLSRLEWAECLDLVPPSRWLTFEPVDYGIPQLAELTALYIVESAASVANIIPATDRLEKYQRWLIKTRVAIIEGKEQRFLTIPWHLLSPTDKARKIETLQQQISRYEGGPEQAGELLRRVFDHSVPLLLGQCSPLEVLTMEHLTDFYDFCASLSDLSRFLSLVRHWNPRVRVLEIGAGTGATCAQVVKLLQSADGVPMCSQYTFTDLSPAFLSRATDRFEGFRFMEYRTLDISKDPLDQGFTAASYDLIIASNVVHATPSLSQSLSNIRKLLVPGGYLLLQELCASILSVDFVMGILPDWWNGEDRRPDRPFVAPARWNDELLKAGFTGAESVTLDNKEPFQVNANIISRNPREPSRKGHITFLVDDTKLSPWQVGLESIFSKQGYATTRTTLQDASLLDSPSLECIISLLDTTDAFVHGIDQEQFRRIKDLFLISSRLPIIWITPSVQTTCPDPRFSLVLGLARTLRREILGKIVTIEVDNVENPDFTSYQAVLNIFRKISDMLFQGETPYDTEYVLRQEMIFTSRFHWSSLQNQMEQIPDLTAARRLELEKCGLIDSLVWQAVPTSDIPLATGQVEVDIHYVGLNFRDLMIILGVMGELNECGLEASATVRRIGPNVTDLRAGDRVIVCSEGVFRTRACVSEHQCTQIPQELPLSDAATLPAAYATAVYSLITVGQVQRGQTVLIHCATGGVGLAAIQICQAIGATIYATAGNKDKREYLHTEFQIPHEHIFNSRDDSFLPAILRQTNGIGVDLVLNSLAGNLLHASWQCVARYGKMIELGKRDLLAHGSLSMNPFLGNRSFMGVDMMGLIQERQRLSRDLMESFLTWYREGKIHPIRPVTIFNAANVADAFKYMQSGKHMGKIIVKMPTGVDHVPTRASKKPMMISENKSYLLVGGLGGIGRAVANWLVENGVRHLIFLSRSAGQSPAHDLLALELQRQGCATVMVAGDVADPDDVGDALSRSDGREIGGVIHLSMVLRDESFAKMTYAQWCETIQPKVTGAWNLHCALKNHEPNLDFFVLFSSMASLVGTVGQSNYAAANTFLDALVQYRQQNGLVASVINLGVVEDIGCVQGDLAVLNRAKFTGARLIREDTVMDALYAAILSSKHLPETQLYENKGVYGLRLSSSIMAIGVSTSRPLSAPGVTPLWGAADIRFSMYENLEVDNGVTVNTSDKGFKALFADIQENPGLLDDPDTEGRIMKELCGLITAHMSHEGVSDDEVASIPIDSLMAIEIRNWFRRKLGIEITLTEISKAGTVGGLSKVTIATLKERYLSHNSQEGK